MVSADTSFLLSRTRCSKRFLTPTRDYSSFRCKLWEPRRFGDSLSLLFDPKYFLPHGENKKSILDSSTSAKFNDTSGWWPWGLPIDVSLITHLLFQCNWIQSIFLCVFKFVFSTGIIYIEYLRILFLLLEILWSAKCFEVLSCFWRELRLHLHFFRWKLQNIMYEKRLRDRFQNSLKV